ncbi:MAG: relaxase/mobilization nuclease domain-containing protein, partial [Alphaproteobacteria bacterium]
MLIFGASGGDWKGKAAYALDKADNEFAQVREIRCEGADDVNMAMAIMAAFAADTKCKDFIYHATMNLYRGERMAGQQWMKGIDRLEKDLGLEGHYRIAFEHIKNDRQHYHIYWFRLPPGGNGPAVNMGNDYYICEKVAIALEKEFGLMPAPRRNKSKPSEKKQEINNRNSRIRVNPEIVTRDVTRIFKNSKTSQEFIKNLAKEGYTLTRGKAQKLVIVDKNGGYHGLVRRLKGIRQGDVTRKFPTLDKMPLPSLNDVLKSRRPAPKKIFRRAAFAASRPAKAYKPRHRTSFSHRPKTRLLGALRGQARKYYPKEEKKNYPPPILRRRKRKIEENMPARPSFNLADIEKAKALEWAWENGRVD